VIGIHHSCLRVIPVAELLSFLGIGRSHSRPHVSNDNPFSERQFKTMKYWPAFPECFGSIEDARVFCEARQTEGFIRPCLQLLDRFRIGILESGGNVRCAGARGTRKPFSLGDRRPSSFHRRRRSDR